MNHISKLKGTRAQSVLIELIVIIIIIIVKDFAMIRTILYLLVVLHSTGMMIVLAGKSCVLTSPHDRHGVQKTLPKRTLILFEDFENGKTKNLSSKKLLGLVRGSVKFKKMGSNVALVLSSISSSTSHHLDRSSVAHCVRVRRSWPSSWGLALPLPLQTLLVLAPSTFLFA